MKHILLLIFALFGTGMFAQESTVTFKSNGAVFSGDNSIQNKNKEIVEFTGNVHFTTSIVEVEKADKIVYDKKTKTFTISGFSELVINGKKRLASDLGSTTLKIDLGDTVAYFIANTKNCPGGKANC
jgi:lipopolysaccharide assembly outer membrane protein LptD (OstA)